MNQKQQEAKVILQAELRMRRNITTPLQDLGESRGYYFTVVDDVTVLIGLEGGYILPAVRRYAAGNAETALDAAVHAGDEFKKNRAGDFKTGHLGGIVSSEDWSCGTLGCRCETQSIDERFERDVKR